MRTLSLSGIALAIVAFALPAAALELTAEEPGATVIGSETEFKSELTDLTGIGEVRWDFGDGERTEFTEGETEVSHTYAAPGHYPVIVVARDDDGFQSRSFVHTVHRPLTDGAPQDSLPLAYHQARNAIITANTDNDSITFVDAESLENVAEVPVLDGPVAVAIAPDGRIWVVHQDAAAIAIIDAESLKVVEIFELPYASQPMGVVFSKEGDAYVTLMALGEVIQIDGTTGEELLRKFIAPFLRGLSLSADGTTLWVTRFISGEGHGEVFQLDAATLEVLVRHELVEDTTTEDSDVQGRGLPNYLFSVALSPDGVEAWIPGKKDNMSRGVERDGLVLTQDNTVRPLIALLDLQSGEELVDERIDLDDRNLPRQITFSPLGDYALVTVFGSNQIEVRDAYTRALVTGLRGGKGPVGTIITSDQRLFVLGDLSRTLVAYDASGILSGADQTTRLLAEVPLVENEALAADVLIGKQLFSNADDPRMASEGYLSCASCHLDGFEDGRVWAFADRGEGLRNTTSLLGRSGMGHGPVHWSGNFDEIQDFEAAIRSGQGGIGFMSDADFFAGTRSEPWGDPKAGVSPDLDAIAAYVAALDRIPPSPYRNQGGSLTTEALAGQATFSRLGCDFCHSGDDFTDSPAGLLHDVGTITADSGSRLGEELVGLDTPTLLGIWQTAPYLHDGSAPTLRDVLTTRNPNGLHGATGDLSDKELDELVAYMLQLEQAPDPTDGSGGSGMGGDSGMEGSGSSDGLGGNPPAPDDTGSQGGEAGCSCKLSQGPGPRWPALPLLLVGLAVAWRRQTRR